MSRLTRTSAAACSALLFLGLATPAWAAPGTAPSVPAAPPAATTPATASSPTTPAPATPSATASATATPTTEQASPTPSTARPAAATADSGNAAIDKLYASLGGASGPLGAPTGTLGTTGTGAAVMHYAGGIIESSPLGTYAVYGANYAKYVALGGDTGALGRPTSNELDGAPGDRISRFEHGIIVWSAQTDAHAVANGIYDDYANNGLDAGPLGRPVTDEGASACGNVSSTFEHGTIIWSSRTGAHAVANAIYAKYGQLGWECGALGLPITDEYTSGTGARATQFERGIVLWSPETGSNAVVNGMFDNYRANGLDAGPLGLPIGDETNSACGYRAQSFQHGTIIWSARTGQHFVANAIYDKYSQLGWECGALGLPISDEVTTAAGNRASSFEHGTIIWSPRTGAHAVTNGNYAAYGAAGWDNGGLGAPTSDEFTGANGARINNFENGIIVWTSWTGSHAVKGGIFGQFAARNYENGPLGAPITEEYGEPGGWGQDFLGGHVDWINGGPRVILLDGRCYTGRVICVDKTYKKLVWVVNGRPVMRMDARTGEPRYHTPEGNFPIMSKVRNEWSYLYNVPMPFTLYFYPGGYAVHYSYDFANHGYVGSSAGCVNTRDWNTMAWLFDQAQVGDHVVVYW